MADFKFLHAADLHLDSPLLGLAGKSAEFAVRLEQASRAAFDNLIDLAIAEGCRFVVLAGDIFDGNLRHMPTGLFFLSRMRRLEDAGIAVFLVAGNHDAENEFASKLALSGNVWLFDRKAAETRRLDDVGAAIHGQSFRERAVTDNIARNYPRPDEGYFNIGVLHTACAGSEGEHAVYAPCTLEQLVNHGYDYWALGHVHNRAVLSEYPHVVYPGNLQGRHARETGPKGATLVTVTDGRVETAEHRDLDVVRWASATVDIGDLSGRSAILERISTNLTIEAVLAGARPLALRLKLVGATPDHGALLLDRGALRDDIEAVCATLPFDIWLEKLVVATQPAVALDPLDPTIAGRLGEEIRRLGASTTLQSALDDALKEIRAKMPAAAGVDGLLERLRAEAPARGVELALALVDLPDAAVAS
jgi:DNA repair exonuclease SbcCD nuclease subunit